MALSFKEKRALQQEIQTCFDGLSQNPDFKTKRSLQKRITDAFAKLQEKIAPIANSLLDDLLAGKFLDQAPLRFLATLKRVLATINDKVELVIAPVLEYMKKHKAEAVGVEEIGGVVTESANSDKDIEAAKKLLDMVANSPRGKQVFGS